MRLFVYGTLQPQAGTDMARWMGERLMEAEPATVPGRLFAIRDRRGWYPALVPAKSGCRVSGTLCALKLLPGDLARLDRYEGHEYRRVSMAVRNAGGDLVPAQVYLWRIGLPHAAPVAVNGDFPAWLRRTRRKAFQSRPGRS